MKPELAPLKDIATAAERIVRFVQGIDYSTFLANEEKQSAVFGQIIIVGEAANRLPAAFRAAHSEVPWPKMIGMRNRIVHGYDEIDWDIVWQVAVDELPELIGLLSPLLPPEEDDR